MVAALLVSPILALMAYFAVDAMVSVPAQPARPGAVYPLRVMSDCRYASGTCTLQNGDVRVQLTLRRSTVWHLASDIRLDGATLGHAHEPEPLVRDDADALAWHLDADDLPVPQDGSLRLVIGVAGSRYFAEFPDTFAVNASPESGESLALEQ